MSEVTMGARTEALFKAGAHFGYSKTRRHPSTGKFVYGTKNKVDIINIEDTERMLDDALALVKALGAKGKTILFVAVKPEARDIIKNTAQSLNQPFVTERWVGGVLTNWVEIKKRIARLEDLKQKKENGELDKYTKKERLLLDEEIAKMHKLFSGLTGMTRMPDAMFIVDAKREHIAATEAHKMNIPVIALMSTDNNIKDAEYPILANDSSISSIEFFANAIATSYRSGTQNTL